MVKTSNEQLSEDENKVMAALRRNSREPVCSLSKRCGFSRQKVWRIIKQLEDQGKIWGYAAIADVEGEGVKKFMLSFKRSNRKFTEKDIDKIVSTRLDDVHGQMGISVMNTYFLQGEYDLVTFFTAKDIVAAKRYSNALMEKFPGLQRLELSQILFTVKEQYMKNPDLMKFTKYL